MRACDCSAAGLARPRRKGEHNTDVPACHSEDTLAYDGVYFTRDPTWLLDNLLGAHNELLDPAG